MTDGLKTPLFDTYLEQVVLGAILIEKHAIAEVAPLLRPEMFYQAEHEEVASCIFTLFGQTRPIDTMTVLMELKQRGNRLNISPVDIAKLTNTVVGAGHIREHVAKLAELYMAREMNRIAGAALGATTDWGTDVFDLIAKLQADVTSLLSKTMQGGLKPIDALIIPTLKQIENTVYGKISGIATGLEDIDKIFYGFKPQELHILAARPGCGKTAMALQVMRDAGRKGKKSALYSLEMSSEMIVKRMLAAEARIPYSKIQRNQMTQDEWGTLTATSGKLAQLPIYIDDSFSQNVQVIHSKAIQRKFSTGLDFIVVDYLQLIGAGRGGKNQIREQVIAEISRGLKGMAKDLDVPVLALSQMSRAVETSGRREPVLSDLRESGAIEQDADSVTFLTPEEDDQPFGAPKTVNWKIAKHRSGAQAKGQLMFDGNYQSFEPLPHSSPPAAGAWRPVESDVFGDRPF